MSEVVSIRKDEDIVCSLLKGKANSDYRVLKGYNHSIAYCLLGYLCAYYRYYHPIEFITAFLNNATNDDDIKNGTALAKHYGIEVVSPKFGISRGEYAFNSERKAIAKGLSSVKHIGAKAANALRQLSDNKQYTSFCDLLQDISEHTDVDSRQLDILIHIDFFSDFGNQRELENIVYYWELFKRGQAKQIKKDKIAGSYIEEIVRRHSTDRKKDGSEASSYTLLDIPAILRECEQKVLSLGIADFGVISKLKSFNEAMGYNGFISGREEDRSTLFIRDVIPVKRKRDGKQFGYSVLTQSVGSGIESRFTVFNNVFDQSPISKGDVIQCLKYRRDGNGYFTMERYRHIESDNK